MIISLFGVLFDGLAYGMLLFLISVGLSVTLGLMNFVNLAHGAFGMVGGYVCAAAIARWNVSFLVALPFAFMLSALARVGARAGALPLLLPAQPSRSSARSPSG